MGGGYRVEEGEGWHWRVGTGWRRGKGGNGGWGSREDSRRSTLSMETCLGLPAHGKKGRDEEKVVRRLAFGRMFFNACAAVRWYLEVIE
jgi:hypothetical protein